MNKNKGFIGIGLIIAIVLGVAIVGGGAYYVGRNTNKWNTGVIIEENNLSNNNDGEINKNVSSRGFAECRKNSKPWIVLVSPNGGEVYSAGQEIPVKWKSCNVPNNVNIEIALLNKFQTNPLSHYIHILLQETPNDGLENVFLLKTKDLPEFKLGKLFKIRLSYVMPDGTQRPEGAMTSDDDSDDYFSIN